MSLHIAIPKKCLKSKKEEEMWEELDWRHMTDESSGDDKNCLHQHHLPWRSPGLILTCLSSYFMGPFKWVLWPKAELTL